MAKISIAANTMILESEFTLDQLKTLEQFNPDALTLCNDKDELLFKVGTSSGSGALSSMGVVFNTTSSNGKAAVSVALPENLEDRKAYATDKYTIAILKLKQVESSLGAAITKITADKASIGSIINVVV